MVRRANSNLLALAIAALCLISCNKPQKMYDFRYIRPGSGDTTTTFTFTLPLLDSAATYNTAMAFRVASASVISSIPLKIDIVTPNGMRYAEQVAVPLLDDKYTRKSRHDTQTSEYEVPYRHGIRVGEDTGEWLLMIRITDPDAASAVSGVGFCYREIL